MASRVCIALVSQYGVRVEVLGNYQGSDGSRLGYFPELRFKSDSVNFEVVPARTVIRPSLSKAGHEYFTFIGPESMEYIKDYLNDRIRKGEGLSMDPLLSYHGTRRCISSAPSTSAIRYGTP